MSRYEFVTIWRFRAPLERVWPFIHNSEAWPKWWRGVEKVEGADLGQAGSIGSPATATYPAGSAAVLRTARELRTPSGQSSPK